MALIALNRLRIMTLAPYLIGGVVLWFLRLKSRVHATVSGVMLAIAIPFNGEVNETSPSHRLEHLLHKAVFILVLPLFALANTGVALSANWLSGLTRVNNVGILAGLLIGKPLGVLLGCVAIVKSGISRLPEGKAERSYVIVPSALGLLARVVQGVEAGADAYLTKGSIGRRCARLGA